jgi:hypothetical protein
MKRKNSAREIKQEQNREAETGKYKNRKVILKTGMKGVEVE